MGVEPTIRLPLDASDFRFDQKFVLGTWPSATFHDGIEGYQTEEIHGESCEERPRYGRVSIEIVPRSDGATQQEDAKHDLGLDSEPGRTPALVEADGDVPDADQHEPARKEANRRQPMELCEMGTVRQTMSGTIDKCKDCGTRWPRTLLETIDSSGCPACRSDIEIFGGETKQ